MRQSYLSPTTIPAGIYDRAIGFISGQILSEMAAQKKYQICCFFCSFCLRTDRGWLDQARGRAVKIIHVLLRELPTDGTYQYRVILMKRPMEEILASQRAMLKRQGKPSADEGMLAKIYASQLAQVEEWLGSQSAFSFLPVEYHRVLKEPREAAAEIDTFLDGGLDVGAMVQVVDPTLHHQRRAT
jgi:hypothetical protein